MVKQIPLETHFYKGAKGKVGEMTRRRNDSG